MITLQLSRYPKTRWKLVKKLAAGALIALLFALLIFWAGLSSQNLTKFFTSCVFVSAFVLGTVLNIYKDFIAEEREFIVEFYTVLLKRAMNGNFDWKNIDHQLEPMNFSVEILRLYDSEFLNQVDMWEFSEKIEHFKGLFRTGLEITPRE